MTRDLFEALDREFHFDFDPCPLNPEWDGLKIPWGRCSFVNPPFSTIGPWVAKAVSEAKEGKTVVMLITARTNANYWHRYIFPLAREIRFMRGKLNFPGYEGRGGLPMGIALVVFEPGDRVRREVLEEKPHVSVCRGGGG